MAPDRLREQLRKLPFVPFTVELGSGTRVRLAHPGYAVLSPAGRTLVVFTDPEDKHMEMIDVFLITKMDVESGSEAYTP